MKFCYLIAVFAIAAAASANAQPTMVKQYDAWGVYSYQTGSLPTCYMLTIPADERPADVDHGDNFFLLAPTKAAQAEYEPQALMGYRLKAGAPVSARIGDERFHMMSDGKSAWLQKPTRISDMIDAMRGGSEMINKATSRRGTKTTYTYSLTGVTAALKHLKECD